MKETKTKDGTNIIALNMTIEDIDSENYLHINNPRARKQLLETIECRHLLDSYRPFHPNK